jgi:hypothetical protein
MKLINVTDTASLALTCRHMARVAVANHTLECGDEAWNKAVILRSTEFFDRLSHSWVPKTLRRCLLCGKFRSTVKVFWEEYKAKLAEQTTTGSIKSYWLDGRNEAQVTLWCGNNKATRCPVCIANRHAFA